MVVDLTDLYSTKVFLYEIDHYNPSKEIDAQTDISFDTSDDSVNATSTDLSIYEINDKLTVAGSASNDATLTVRTVSTTKLTVDENVTTEAAGASISLTAVETLRLTTANGFITAPGDTPANVFYEGRISQRINTFFNRNMYRERATLGSSDASFGELIIDNLDGFFDDFTTHSFNGRDIVVKIGDTDSSFTDYLTILTGTMSKALFTFGDINIIVRDKTFQLENPIQAVRFAGTNSGSTGNEGLADDIEGQPKPLCYGECKNISLIPVNTSALRYQFHAAGTISSVDNVYDAGVLLVLTTDYTVDTANGIIDLVATPSGQVTADVKGDATGSGYIEKVGDIVQRILENQTDLVTADIDTASITALNSTNGSTVGIYIPDEITVRPIIDQLLNSIGAFGGFNRAGLYTVDRFEAATGSTVKDFTTDDILELQIVSQEDEAGVIPIFEIKLGYEKNFLVQNSGEIAGSVSDARRAFLEQEFRHVTDSDATVQISDLLSKPLLKDTLLVSKANADTEATRLLTLYKEKRFIFEITVKAEALSLDINDVISITYETREPDGSFKAFRFGLDATKGVIIGIREDTRTNTNLLTVYV